MALGWYVKYFAKNETSIVASGILLRETLHEGLQKLSETKIRKKFKFRFLYIVY